ncbi:MAG: magnesium/cobalt transporter CorA [Flavobacteriales bacterium]|nr:magnesium/cobalt transporter CorA [Flavobacteriales bacterium]
MKKVRSRSGKAGLPPGSLVQVGDVSDRRSHVTAFIFNADEVKELEVADINHLPHPDPSTHRLWLDLDGMGDEQALALTGGRFDLHPLLLEDVLNFDQRPKVEEYADNLFVVVKMLDLDEETGALETEQVSLVLGRGYLVTFQEKPGDVLGPIRERLRHNLGRVRKAGADYLLYALLDVIVDHYFTIVEEVGGRIEAIERKVSVNPGNEDLLTLQELRSLLISINRYVMPTRELAGRLSTLQSDLIEKSTRRYLNDLQDHTVYIAESIGTFRELLTSLENTYHAGVNLRMGQVIKVLTIISTIFIPLTFIVGIYGMNFDHMPELRWRYGYFGVLGAMSIMALLMLAWFRRKRWL